MPELVFESVSARPQGARGGKGLALQDVSFALPQAGVTGLVGPNGAGKSTLLRAAIGALPVQAGRVLLDGRDPARLAPRVRAQAIGYLPQARPLAWPMRVRDVVALGRFAAVNDPHRIDDALGRMQLASLADRRCDTLSGGELARVHLARMLANGASFAAYDEPIAGLDPAHGLNVMAHLRARAAGGAQILVAMHDLTLAARTCDHILVLHQGRLVQAGPPRDALNARTIEQVFGLASQWVFLGGKAELMLLGPV